MLLGERVKNYDTPPPSPNKERNNEITRPMYKVISLLQHHSCNQKRKVLCFMLLLHPLFTVLFRVLVHFLILMLIQLKPLFFLDIEKTNVVDL